MRFTPSQRRFAGSGYAGWDIHRTCPTCPQIKRRPIHRMGSSHAQFIEASLPNSAKDGANRSAAPRKGMSGQQMIASNDGRRSNNDRD
jgi:hypothetical protein